jgi:hypothetical protein
MWAPDSRYIYFTARSAARFTSSARRSQAPVEQVTKGERRLNGLSDRSRVHEDRLHRRPSTTPTRCLLGQHRRLRRAAPDRDLHAGSRARSRSARRSGSLGEQRRHAHRGLAHLPARLRPRRAPYPLIVNSHGGPHSATGYSFDFKKQSSPPTATSCSTRTSAAPRATATPSSGPPGARGAQGRPGRRLGHRPRAEATRSTRSASATSATPMAASWATG